MLVCFTCKNSYGPEKFYKDVQRPGRGSRGIYCKECHKGHTARRSERLSKRWASENPYDNVKPKKCPGCLRQLNRSLFYRCSSNHDGLQAKCKGCSGRNQNVRTMFDAMVCEQQGRCFLCEKPTFRLTQDHNHKCCGGGNVVRCGKCERRLLCDTCNWALGQAYDSPELLRKMANYIEVYDQMLLSV